ncbi:MAG TPA: sugar ABC transporter permease, partial [Streptomyces sp.]|nr:sugar ABC transporter permease [Streptomyces sp.]
YKIVYFFPQVLSLAILAVLFGAVYRSDSGGMLNGLLLKLGLVDESSPGEWLNEPNFVLWALILVVVWHGVGFYLVLFSAAMQAIPRDIYEAALIDGAGRAHTFFRITLPLLWDSVQTAWVYLGIVAMDMFILVSTMTAGEYGGGPDHHSEVMATVMMRNFLLYGRSGYACAMGVVMLLLTLIVSVVMLRATRRERVEF